MIGYIILIIAWSLLILYLGINLSGINLSGKTRDNRIENLERSVAFHKDQKEMFVEHVRAIVQENNHLKERNTQLINENNKLKKKTAGQSRKCDVQFLYKQRQLGGK